MTLLTRLSRLFQADLHAFLDRIEEPEALLRHAIREMEEALEDDEQRLKLLRHEQEQLQARQTELGRSLAEIEEKLDVCLASVQDDLARKLIQRKLEAENFGKFLARKRLALEDTLQGLMTRLAENRARLNSMRQKAELLAEEDRSDPDEDRWSTPDFAVREEDIEIALLREKQKRSRP